MVRASFVNEVNSAITGTGFFDVADFDITTKPEKWSQDPNNRGLLKDGVEIATKLLTGNVDK